MTIVNPSIPLRKFFNALIRFGIVLFHMGVVPSARQKPHDFEHAPWFFVRADPRSCFLSDFDSVLRVSPDPGRLKSHGSALGGFENAPRGNSKSLSEAQLESVTNF